MEKKYFQVGDRIVRRQRLEDFKYDPPNGPSYNPPENFIHTILELIEYHPNRQEVVINWFFSKDEQTNRKTSWIGEYFEKV